MYFRYQLTFELNVMLEIYKYDYKFRVLKRAIEKLENDQNSYIYFGLLYALNKVYKFFFNEICKDFKPKEKDRVVDEIFQHYLSYLKKYRFVLGEINEKYKEEYRADFQSQLLNHWNKVLHGYEEDEKSFLEVFDEMHSGSIAKYPELFTIRLGKLKNLYRAQSGKHFGNYARMIPDPKYTKNNRWNPEGVTFLYLAYSEEILPFDDTINMIEKTCFEEYRLAAGSDVTVCGFRPIKTDVLLINLCFQDISFEIIEQENQDFINTVSKEKVNQILNKAKYKRELMILGKDNEMLKDRIMEIIRDEISDSQTRQRLREETEKYVGRLIMKSIEEAVFVPVDKKSDPELKAYIPFHHLAKYLQNKGYAGIIYKSTRMDAIGLKGKNVVLFDSLDAEPIPGSMKVYHFDDKSYNSLTS